MNRVDDERDAGAFGGEPAEDSRLAAVGVDDVGFLFAENLFQSAQREKILQRMNGADQFGNDVKAVPAIAENRVPANLPGPRPGRKSNAPRRRVSRAGRGRWRWCFPGRRRR